MRLVKTTRQTTRERILEAANACFRDAGVRRTNVLDIVARAGIGRSTFYRSFRDIDDILVTLAVGVWNRHLPALARGLSATAIPAPQRWRDFIATLATIPQSSDGDDRLREDDVNVVRLFYGKYPERRQDVVDSLVPLLDSARDRGELRADVASPRLAEWILRQAWVLSSLPLSGRWRREELDDYIETFVLVSLLAPEQRGLAALESEIGRLARLVDRLEKNSLQGTSVMGLA